MTHRPIVCYVFDMETAEYLRQIVTALAQDIGARSYRDIDKLKNAAAYISSEFTSFGYKVVQQPFFFFGNVYHNLITERAGSSSKEILVVGAHYDTVRTTPGADDNASGVAGLLGLARALTEAKPAVTVRFVAFCLEEPPVCRTPSMGSYQYAGRLKADRENIVGMISLEMIGYFCDKEGCQRYPFPFMNAVYPKAGNYISLVGNMRSRSFTRSISDSLRKATDLPVLTLNAPPIMIGIDFSDHWSFGKFGYKALMVTDTAFYRNPHYHAPDDLPETLDYERMAKVVDGLTVAVREWGRK